MRYGPAFEIMDIKHFPDKTVRMTLMGLMPMGKDQAKVIITVADDEHFKIGDQFSLVRDYGPEADRCGW